MSPPELLELPAWPETLPAVTGSRVAPCPADGVPTTDRTADSLPIAGVPSGGDR